VNELSPDARPAGDGSLESTAALLARVEVGVPGASDDLVRRFLPILRRWAHGRLPWSARDLAETDDLVHMTLLRALNHVKRFELRREGAFLAYLRRILLNQIRDEYRRYARQPKRSDLHESFEASAPSPLEELIGVDQIERFEKALATLPPKSREAVILRLEFGYTHQQVAEAIGSASPGAARKLVARALLEVADAMQSEARP
jgi:RNA polymerase sigma-70 factor (ECF subfamily)